MVDDSPKVSRRCLVHYLYDCKAEECLADAVDLATNSNRPRPQPTPGAPEVTWGVSGNIHRDTREEQNDEAPAGERLIVGLISNASVLLPDTGTALARLKGSVLTNPDKKKAS